VLVYVAGPYRGKSRFRLIRFFQVLRNIWRARRVAAELWGMGFVAVCPHLNTLLMDGIGPPEMFIEGDLEILAKCDAIFVLPDYWSSEGTKGEIEFAGERGIPVYYTVGDLLLDTPQSQCWWSRRRRLRCLRSRA
jgi:nucleoside 2-deoxyribosyltransferase